MAGPNVLRLAPPLNIGDTELEEGLNRLNQAAVKFIQAVESSP